MDTIQTEVGKLRVHYDIVWEENVKNKYCNKAQKNNNKERKFFAQFWQGFAWSAIIGFINNKRSSLDINTKQEFGEYNIIKNNAPYIFDALINFAIAKSNKNHEILNRPDEIALIISEYAKGGAEYIKEIRETPGMENYFNSEDDFLNELLERKKD